MRYRHRFLVHVPLPAVAAFHRILGALRLLTPTVARLRLHDAAPVREGSRVDFTLHLGPLPVRWVAVHCEVSEAGFVDEQVEGPFRTWRHRHAFRSAGDGLTEVVDEIEATLKRNPLWAFVGLALWASLPLLFRHRGRATRRALERGAR